MPLTRQDKDQMLADYAGGLADTQHAFLLGFQGISVPQVTALRARIRAQGGRYIVVKNTLALRAIGGKPLDQLRSQFTGATAVAYTDKDPVALAKALTEFAKDAPSIQFKGALLEGRAVEASAVKEIASLPSREELIAKILFLLQAPIVRLARVLAAVPQSFVAVLDQIRIQKDPQG
ncbi:MAG: 50S ribosomal protein L10 [Holophagales bacterium]|nr:MAG: 50S ribosomal protein L10 [Holophagales bacterium]